MLVVKENVDIKNYSTFKIGGHFRYFVDINNNLDIEESVKFSKEKKIPLFIFGSGSNCIFKDEILDIIALRINMRGFEVIIENDEFIDIKIGAGETMDHIIKKTIMMNLSGLESLSAIPGTIGATPVQNVGAYGVEVKDVITSVEVYNIKTLKFEYLSNLECKFGYRDSIFKNVAKNQYIITGVVFRLKKVLDNSNLIEKRKEIINIRWSKLPKPEEFPNVGSFFKNPIVQRKVAEEILKDFPDARFFPINDNLIKVPAGWLIENAGLKGKSFGSISVYDKNALILVNNGGAKQIDVENVKNKIVKVVQDKFGIILEQEPEVV